MKNLFLCFPRWTTCAKARNWLNQNNIDFEERNIKENNPNEDELRKWIFNSDYPINKFFNSSGKLYRELKLKDKLSEMEDAEKIKLLATDGMLVKRPIYISDDIILIGFKEDEWKVVL